MLYLNGNERERVANEGDTWRISVDASGLKVLWARAHNLLKHD